MKEFGLFRFPRISISVYTGRRGGAGQKLFFLASGRGTAGTAGRMPFLSQLFSACRTENAAGGFFRNPSGKSVKRSCRKQKDPSTPVSPGTRADARRDSPFPRRSAESRGAAKKARRANQGGVPLPLICSARTLFLGAAPLFCLSFKTAVRAFYVFSGFPLKSFSSRGSLFYSIFSP